MHGHTRWLIDQNEVAILKKDIERNIFRQRRGWHWIRHLHEISDPGLDRAARVVLDHVLCALLLAHAAFFDQRLGARTR